MPSLRFSRDKRGNEITSLVLQSRRHGKGGPRVLYWYRTPPNVRVGRTALDEHAIRLLEEAHPDVVFDWTRILHGAGPEALAGGRTTRASRPRAGQQKPRSRAARRRPQPEHPLDLRTELPGAPDDLLTALAGDSRPAPSAGAAAVAPVQPGVEHPPASAAAAGVVSREEVARLRTRYAAVLARITERVSDAARADALRLEAEALNPDAWVTPDEVRSGVAAFDEREQHLRSLLGRRRRSRRGGIRHRRLKTPDGSEGSQRHGGPSSQGSDPAAG